ncbi:hypothetical protein ASF41_22095 [Methylobacterium sp. Leaf111]|uniref:hypothetical protein n=1 Tax=Methylobacterium sp. Leaf111 TaxID=1736257 RepID=UPI0007012FEA|nr:hypothetical protein [Methylobacterium sp. Leaf111]KQP64052.1 hypothetical protein ASF41_22095 [Methylobacterium sp. Leaf111]
MLKSMLITAILGLSLRSTKAACALTVISAVAVAAVSYVSTYRDLGSIRTMADLWSIMGSGSVAYLFGAFLL